MLTNNQIFLKAIEILDKDEKTEADEKLIDVANKLADKESVPMRDVAEAVAPHFAPGDFTFSIFADKGRNEAITAMYLQNPATVHPELSYTLYDAELMGNDVESLDDRSQQNVWDFLHRYGKDKNADMKLGRVRKFSSNFSP